MAKHKSASGLIWSTQKLDRKPFGGNRETVKFAHIKQLPESGLFAAEVASQDPDIQAVAISLEGYAVDFTGIESMPRLSELLIHNCEGILPYSGAPAGTLNLKRVIMPYAGGVTEQFLASPPLQDVEVDGGPLDMLQDLSGSARKVTLRRVKSASRHTDWGMLGQVEEFEIVQSGKIEVLPPRDRWPQFVNFTLVSALEGIVQASKIQPFRGVAFNGVRAMDPTASIWDLQANCVYFDFDFNARPPKWLIEAWDDRPKDWADVFRVPEHRLLPGSEDQDWERNGNGYIEHEA
ncbi:hypothetical protein [Paeniglutamicibacter sp.]|uniref:hypothetical protein n=1 Tax=Paeniglutamicibacter sp. TaxID=1934391 RepID=UPI003989F40C